MLSGDLNFRRLFEQSPDLLLVLLPDGPRFGIVGATEAYLSVTHTTREETFGRGLFEVFPDNPDDPSATGARNLRASLERVVASRAPDTMAVQKYDIRGPDGTFQVRYWSPKNIPVLSESGDVQYILHRVEDVTELVRASELGEDLRGRTREMEREVIKRSQELSAANERLEAANKELDAFSYSVSHDLRAPLRHVIGFAEILERHAAATMDETGRRHLQTIVTAAKNMAQLIEDLLAFSRMGRAPIVKRPIDLNDLVQEARRELIAHGGVDGRQVEWRIAALPTVEADRALLRQAVLNLVSNALKYSAPREKTCIEIGTSDQAPGEVVVYVRDNGVGFDMQFADKLFGVFQRLHRADQFEGTGIGLANVKRILTRHGGRVWAESAPDRGATFFFSLPAES